MRRRRTTAIKLKLMLGIASIAVGAQGVIPENDSFATRITLTGASVATTGSNVSATKEADEPDPNFTGGKSVWWTWTAPADGYATFTTTGSTFDTTVAVYTGNVLSNLNLVAFNDGDLTTSTVSFNVTNGTAYQIQVDGCDNDLYETNKASGTISLQITLGAIQPAPANDRFANRIAIVGNHVNNTTGSNLGATAEPGEPFHADTLGFKSVWWTWTAPASGGLSLNTQGSSIDTVLAVYTGNSVANLTLVAANDEEPDFGYQSALTCNVTSNVTYQIAVDGFEGAAGDIKIRLDLDAAFPIPANDNFANRITLTGSNINTNWSNVGATYEPNEPMHLVTFGGKTVWWSWTAPASGGVTLSVSNNNSSVFFDTLVAVYRGSSLTNLTFVAGNDEDFYLSPAFDGDSTAYFNATNGTTYVIVVDGVDGLMGNFNLKLTLGAADPAPANNNFANRITLTGTNVTTTGSNLGATFEVGEPLHRGYYGGASIWWKWTAPGPGFVSIDTTNSVTDVPDTLLAVYTGTALTDLVEVASDNNSGGGNWASKVVFPTKAGVIYSIAVDGVDGDTWDNIRLNIHYISASYSLTATSNPAGAGSVTINPLPDQGGNYAPGSVVTLTATPAGGNTFTGWSGDATSSSTSIVVAMTSNKVITANFYVPPSARNWTGASPSSGNWTDNLNWNPAAPNAGDDLIFPSSAARLTSNTNNLAANTAFNSITLGGDGYLLRGNTVNLSNGILATNSSGTNTLQLAIQLNSNQSLRSTVAGARLELMGNIALGNRTLTAEATGDIALAGIISGNGGLVKTNTGTLSLLGNNTNTYTGATVINQGTIELGKTGVAIPGALTIGDGSGGVNADIVRFKANNQLAAASAVTINTSGQLDLDGFTGSIASLGMTGGNLDTGAGTLGLGGNLTTSASSFQANINGRLSLLGSTRTFTVPDGAATTDLLISAVITNGASAAGITKAGNGTMQLSGANNYSGTTTVNAGTLSVANASALGSTSQGTFVNSGTLAMSGVTISSETLALTGATLQSDSGSNVWTGSIAITNACVFPAVFGTTLNLPTIISGTGSLTKTGDGTLILSGASANTYSGGSVVNQGTLALAKAANVNAIPGALTIGDSTGGTDADIVRLDSAQQIPSTAAVTLNSSGLLNLNNLSNSVAAISGSGHVEFGGSSSTLTLGANNATSSFSGLISGAGQLIKAGNGTLTLSANNSYTGQTTVNGGTLIVNGTQSGSAVVVNSSATLGGTGRVGNLSGSGTISPGSSPGMLSSGNVNFSANTTFRVELNGTTVGSGYDQLNVSGTVSLAGALNATLGFTPGVNDSFTIIDNNASDSVTGTFSGLPQGANFAIGNVLMQISYNSGVGANNVVLTRVAVPAPVITSITTQTNAAKVQGTGMAGLTYVLENAPNLDVPITWSAVSTNTANTNGVFQFTHTNAFTIPSRYYRVRWP